MTLSKGSVLLHSSLTANCHSHWAQFGRRLHTVLQGHEFHAMSIVTLNKYRQSADLQMKKTDQTHHSLSEVQTMLTNHCPNKENTVVFLWWFNTLKLTRVFLLCGAWLPVCLIIFRTGNLALVMIDTAEHNATGQNCSGQTESSVYEVLVCEEETIPKHDTVLTTTKAATSDIYNLISLWMKKVALRCPWPSHILQFCNPHHVLRSSRPGPKCFSLSYIYICTYYYPVHVFKPHSHCHTHTWKTGSAPCRPLLHLQKRRLLFQKLQLK